MEEWAEISHRGIKPIRADRARCDSEWKGRSATGCRCNRSTFPQFVRSSTKIFPVGMISAAAIGSSAPSKALREGLVRSQCEFAAGSRLSTSDFIDSMQCGHFTPSFFHIVSLRNLEKTRQGAEGSTSLKLDATSSRTYRHAVLTLPASKQQTK